jgi:predicted AlkP superfamily phosphohydrolase/phosphomutase
MFRIYAKQLRPRFEVYVSPVNIDPMAPDIAITTPHDLGATFAKQIGRFHTQGMAEDTSALRAGVLNVEEFIAQTQTVLDESRALFREELARFESGLLFFYFSSVDQTAHMLWEDYDPELLKVYQQVDEAIGEAMAVAGESTTLIVMSDHGFMRYKRSVHLNTILMNEGFLALDDPANVGDAELFAHVDWSRTQAYALGLNAIYLNRYGRERGGIVAEGEEQQVIMDRIRALLVAFRDPETSEQAIDDVYQPAQVFQGKNLEFAPDLLVGYRPPYRGSWETTLGGVPGATVGDNTDAWIGDHCVAPRFVPGVWLSNRKSPVSEPRLVDLPVTILGEFGFPPGQGMLGRELFSH